MTNQGIDYGMGMANVDVKTGIRFGVIPHYVLGGFWYEESEPVYPEPEPRDEDDDEDDYADCVEPVEWRMDDGEYKAEQSADSCDVFVLKSPYFTRAQFCSPCAPGACYLLNPVEDGVRAYCFGPDCFYDNEDGVPYDVFSVETGKRVARKGTKPE